jgi:hypothetical protein
MLQSLSLLQHCIYPVKDNGQQRPAAINITQGDGGIVSIRQAPQCYAMQHQSMLKATGQHVVSVV